MLALAIVGAVPAFIVIGGAVMSIPGVPRLLFGHHHADHARRTTGFTRR